MKTKLLITSAIAIIVTGVFIGKSFAQTGFSNDFSNADNPKLSLKHKNEPLKYKPLYTTFINNKPVTDTKTAEQVINDLFDAWNNQDWKKFQSLVYNTAPVSLPDDWFKVKMGGDKWNGTKSITVGKPYVLQNWTTPTKSAIVDHANHVAQDFNVVVKNAVAVAVTFSDQPGKPVIYHVFLDNDNKWKVAYSRFNGFELFDSPNDLVNAVKK